MTNKTFKFDAFISYSSTDRKKAEAIYQILADAGLRVWIDFRQLKPGDDISLKIERGLEDSRCLVSLLSAESLSSDWVNLERHTQIFRDPSNKFRRYIPVLLEDAELPVSISRLLCIDWRKRRKPIENLVRAVSPLIQFRRVCNIAILTLPCDRVLDYQWSEMAEEVKGHLSKLIESDIKTILVDFSYMKVVSSKILGIATAFGRRIHDRGGQVVFCGICKIVYSQLEIIPFEKIPNWDVIESVDEAIEKYLKED